MNIKLREEDIANARKYNELLSREGAAKDYVAILEEVNKLARGIANRVASSIATNDAVEEIQRQTVTLLATEKAKRHYKEDPNLFKTGAMNLYPESSIEWSVYQDERMRIISELYEQEQRDTHFSLGDGE